MHTTPHVANDNPETRLARLETSVVDLRTDLKALTLAVADYVSAHAHRSEDEAASSGPAGAAVESPRRAASGRKQNRVETS